MGTAAEPGISKERRIGRRGQRMSGRESKGRNRIRQFVAGQGQES